MKKALFFLSIFFSFNFLFAQDAQEILQKMFLKCQSVQNGYYEMTSYMKFMSGNDTFKSTYKCHFKKLKDDSLYPSAFHYQKYFKGEYSYDAMYTGDEFVNFSSNDSTGTVMSKSMWASEIKAFKHNYNFYDLLTDKNNPLFLHDSDFINGKRKIKFIGEEKVNNISCYRIRMNEFPKKDSIVSLEALKLEYQFWVRKDDFLPIQYSLAIDLLMNNDTMYQYERIILDKYVLNNLTNESPIQLNSIPPYYKLNDYIPYERPKLLPKDTLAPIWTLMSLTDEKVNLDDLKGQLVLIDFFYKSCYPCMQALPALQALHVKYKDKGLRIIGIDPYDKKEDEIAAFLAKRGVTYTVLLEGKNVTKDYRVSGYPTLYLIDKTGKIIFSQVGYGKGTEEVLEEIIKKNL